MSRGLYLCRLGGSGALPREKIDFQDGWRTILSLFYGRKFVFFQEIFFHITHVRIVRNGRYAFDLLKNREIPPKKGDITCMEHTGQPAQWY